MRSPRTAERRRRRRRFLITGWHVFIKLLGARLRRQVNTQAHYSLKSAASGRRSASRQLIVPRVRRSTFGARAFAIAGPTVRNSLPDSMRDPAVGPDQFRRDLKTHLFEWHCVSFSALAVFSRNALYKLTFYLLTYLLTYLLVDGDLKPYSVTHSPQWQSVALTTNHSCVCSCLCCFINRISCWGRVLFYSVLWPLTALVTRSY